jgi:hypothetical protein
MLDRARSEHQSPASRSALIAFVLAGIAIGCLFVLGEVEKAWRLNWVEAWQTLLATAGVMLVCGLLMSVWQAVRYTRYDPNTSPVEERIARGRQRAVSREQFRAGCPDAEREHEERSKA